MKSPSSRGKEKQEPMNPTKIVVGAKRTAPAAATSTPARKQSVLAPLYDKLAAARKKSFFSPLYGKLIGTPGAAELCKRLGMSRSDVLRLRRKFDEEDGANSDTVTMRGFVHLINDDKAFERSQLVVHALLGLAGIKTAVARVTFDEYLRVVCTFASFTDTQLWRFFYDACCTSDTGVVIRDPRRLGALLNSAGGSYTNNIQIATRQVAASTFSSQTGMPTCISFEDFLALVRRNPTAFFPFVKMQRIIRTRTLGEKYWNKKAREQLLQQPLVEYLHRHRGKLPRMGFKNWVMSLLHGGNTAVAHARALARRQYLEEVAKKSNQSPSSAPKRLRRASSSA